MKFSQRVPRSEIHFYLQKLLSRGYEKVSSSQHRGGYIVKLKRIKDGKEEHLSVKFSNNGWCSMM